VWRFRLKQALVKGLLVIVPAWGTLLILGTLVATLEGFVGAVLGPFLRVDVPGVGLLAGLGVILLTGLVATRVAGKRLLRWAEESVETVPLISGVYRTLKGVADVLNFRTRFGRSAVVAFPFPREGLYALGFVMGAPPPPVQAVTAIPLTMLFVPTAIHPFTGYLAFVPQQQIFPVNLAPEEAMKLEFSAGLYRPKQAVDRAANPEGTGG
jgi:uncharacterized membrane protein